jgi:enoyl-[acyl-carrier-protein] reductase (NADH)
LIPEDVAKGKRYRQFSGYSIQEVVDQVQADFGTIDYMVHSLANGPEVTKALLDTSRAGYLAASSASAYSLVSMVSRFAPIMNPGEYFVAANSQIRAIMSYIPNQNNLQSMKSLCRRICYLPHIHCLREGHPRLRRRHEFCQGRFRE